nr:HlyC/CorC family transporter [Nitrospinota bacterium]
KKKPQRLLITILIGNNVVNIGASVFATVVATEIFGNHVIGLVTGILTILILVFGEIIPKTFSHKYAEGFSLSIAYPIYFLQEALSPLIWLLERIILLINKIFGIDPHSDQVVSEEELRAMVDLSSEEGSIEASEAELIDNVIDFSTTLVEEVMTPRSDICAVDDSKTVKETMELMVQQGLHSRLPVYHETLENLTGVVALREMAKLYLDSNQVDRPLVDLKLTDPIVVPITQPIKQLFNEFLWKQRHLALVVDEHGSVVGLVTMEDILEEIMGEIRDETDSEELKDIIKLKDKSWSINGKVELKTIYEEIDIWLGETAEQDLEEGRKTLSLLLIECFQRIPKVGKSLVIKDCQLTIEKVENFAIKRVHVQIID